MPFQRRVTSESAPAKPAGRKRRPSRPARVSSVDEMAPCESPRGHVGAAGLPSGGLLERQKMSWIVEGHRVHARRLGSGLGRNEAVDARRATTPLFRRRGIRGRVSSGGPEEMPAIHGMGSPRRAGRRENELSSVSAARRSTGGIETQIGVYRCLVGRDWSNAFVEALAQAGVP
jgi:hypothetical protein